MNFFVKKGLVDVLAWLRTQDLDREWDVCDAYS